MFAVFENELARQNDEAFGLVTLEMLISMIEQLYKFARI